VSELTEIPVGLFRTAGENGRPNTVKRALLLIAVLTAGIVLPACGGGTHSGRSMQGHAAGMRSTANHNSQDVMFAQMMIPHHQQAITMSDLAPTRASSPRVKRLAAHIKNAQEPEIDKMSGWLKDWGEPTHPRVHMHMAEGMMSEEDMNKLETLSRRAFDRMFLQMMIKHHQGAVTMARTEQEEGVNPDAKALAGSIVTSQTAEITRMRNLLKNL
jgi:uncharacterized protein (DUF305 family)